jgi:diguanylate cyclase (GGDEF)-like protein
VGAAVLGVAIGVLLLLSGTRRIRRNLEPGQDQAAVTASIGVGGYPDHASTLDRLERLADAALYLAKRHGRNRVEQAGPPVAEVANLPGRRLTTRP